MFNQGRGNPPHNTKITMKRTEFEEKALRAFQRQTCDLERYMNGYSITLRRMISEEDFGKLYDTLCYIIDKYNK